MKHQELQDIWVIYFYEAPEVMRRQDHSLPSDFFAVGVLIYELMLGKVFFIIQRPYNGISRKEVKESILSKQASISKNELPIGWSIEAADIANRLLERKPYKRLGFDGIEEVMNHAWFKDFKWRDLELKKMKGKFIPDVYLFESD